MQFLNRAERYGLVSRTIHWLTVVLVLSAWTVGTFADDLLDDDIRGPGLLLHVYPGLGVVVLLAMRLVWQAANPMPPLSGSTLLGVWGERAAKLTHFLLYILLLAVPVAGVLVLFERGEALSVFGLFDVEPPLARIRALRSIDDVHETLANALIAIAGLHGGAALFHHWVLGDRTLARMLPGRR